VQGKVLIYSAFILSHICLENVTKSVTNCQLSVTFGMDVVCFASALKRCSTDGHHVKKDPWHSERSCKQAGSLKVTESPTPGPKVPLHQGQFA